MCASVVKSLDSFLPIYDPLPLSKKPSKPTPFHLISSDLEVSLSSQFQGSYYGGISPSVLFELLGASMYGRYKKRACISQYIRRDSAQMDLKDFAPDKNPAFKMASLHKQRLESNEGVFDCLGDLITNKVVRIKRKPRGSNDHLAYVIDRERDLKACIGEHKGLMSFLTFTSNFNVAGDVVHQSEVLRGLRDHFLKFLKNDFGFEYLWVWEVNPLSGFLHLHLIVLGLIPKGWFFGSGIFNSSYRHTKSHKTYTSSKGRGSTNFNDFMKAYDPMFQSNSLDVAHLSSNRAHKRVSNYLSNYLTKNMALSSSCCAGSSSKELSYSQKQYWLGLCYLLNLRIFGSSKSLNPLGLSKGYDNLKVESSKTDSSWVYLGRADDPLLLSLMDGKDPPCIQAIFNTLCEIRRYASYVRLSGGS